MTEQYPSPVLSVIVPVYKVEKYLETCVRSLLDQRWKDLEVILVDDGSPDGCPDLCEAFAAADPRVRVVHKENAGLGLARNSGLDVASGEYVTFVDSDDYVDTETFSSLLERHSPFDPDVIYYRYGRFTDTTRGRTVHSETCDHFSGDGVQELMLDMISAPVTSRRERVIECSACTAIYRRSLLERYSIRFHSERKLYSEDMIFNLDFLSHADRAVYDHSVLYFYRRNPSSVTQAVNMSRCDMMERFNVFMAEAMPEWGLSAEQAGPRFSKLVIGHARSELIHALSSKGQGKFKHAFFRKVVGSPSLRTRLSGYPWQGYALYQKAFYWAMRLKSYPLAWGLSNLKNSFK